MKYKFNTHLIKFLICPITRENLSFDKKLNKLINESNTYCYEIKNGIPILFAGNAVKLK